MRSRQAQAQRQEYMGVEEQSVAPTYQQKVDHRNQAIAQAILEAHQQTGPSNNAETGNRSGTSAAAAQPAPLPVAVSNAQDMVDLTEVWKRLDKKSTVWSLLMDEQSKVLTVAEYMDRFRKQGVKINEPPMHYVSLINQIVRENPQMLERPFGELVQIVAIVDYDFDNGMDKDMLARKVLGEAGFQANKRRFTQQL